MGIWVDDTLCALYRFASLTGSRNGDEDLAEARGGEKGEEILGGGALLLVLEDDVVVSGGQKPQLAGTRRGSKLIEGLTWDEQWP